MSTRATSAALARAGWSHIALAAAALVAAIAAWIQAFTEPDSGQLLKGVLLALVLSGLALLQLLAAMLPFRVPLVSTVGPPQVRAATALLILVAIVALLSIVVAAVTAPATWTVAVAVISLAMVALGGLTRSTVSRHVAAVDAGTADPQD